MPFLNIFFLFINLFFYNPFNIFDRFADIEVAVANGIVDGVESVVCAIDVFNERLFADGWDGNFLTKDDRADLIAEENGNFWFDDVDFLLEKMKVFGEDGVGKFARIELRALAEICDEIFVFFDVAVDFIGKFWCPITAFDAADGLKNIFINKV